MVRWCWVNFQCLGVLLIWIIVEQGPTALAVGAGGVVWTFLSHLSFLFSFSLSLVDGLINQLVGSVSNNLPTMCFSDVFESKFIDMQLNILCYKS